MKTFAIELRRTSYITLLVEADNAEAAEDVAWKELDAHEHRDADADWAVEAIEEQA